MSKRFRIGYSQDEYGYYYFSAKDLKEAKALIEQLEEGEIDVEDLPDFYNKINGGEHDWVNRLEEVTD